MIGGSLNHGNPSSLLDTPLQFDGAARVVDGTSPGTHTATIAMDNAWMARGAYKLFRGCSQLYDLQGPVPAGFAVGWGEYDGCIGWLDQVAVSFQDAAAAAFAAIPDYTTDRVVLSYDEIQDITCDIIGGDPGQGGCWRDGKGYPEQKSNGCVVVRAPSGEWRNNEVAHGMTPFLNAPPGPSVKQISPSEWDVTEAYDWQNFPATRPIPRPGDPAPSAGFGFLLSGSADIVALAGEDSTSCSSRVSNIRLTITYTVPNDQGGFVPPR